MYLFSVQSALIQSSVDTLPFTIAGHCNYIMVEELSRMPAVRPRINRDVFYFAHTRTASHVLCRLLSTQPGWVQSDYHFKRAFDFARDTFGWGPLSDASDEHRKGFENLLQEGFDQILQERQSAASKVGHSSSLLFAQDCSLTTTEQSFLPQRTHILHMGTFSIVAEHVGRTCESPFHSNRPASNRSPQRTKDKSDNLPRYLRQILQSNLPDPTPGTLLRILVPRRKCCSTRRHLRQVLVFLHQFPILPADARLVLVASDG